MKRIHDHKQYISVPPQVIVDRAGGFQAVADLIGMTKNGRHVVYNWVVRGYIPSKYAVPLLQAELLKLDELSLVIPLPPVS